MPIFVLLLIALSLDLARPVPWALHCKTPAIAWAPRMCRHQKAFACLQRPSEGHGSRRQPDHEEPGFEERCPDLMLKKMIFQPSIRDMLKARLHRHWPEHTSDINGIDFDTFIATMRNTRARISSSCLKTRMGGWTTGARLHEGVAHRCVFGCPAADDWAHYADCLPMWSAVYFTLGAPPPTRRFECMGLRAQRPEDLDPVAFETYRTVKHGHLQGALDARQQHDYQVPHALTDRLAMAAARLVQ
ncbi:unnamed protein product [Prorocentrum cordatum]|uniref:Uncharacterized protein n=1 Tax=Prorocentrum cordatum TaxID=2364126 RepID=A0ABN9YBK2_9DINO|nr:unnamed protein product [Polarella glacialis]